MKSTLFKRGDYDKILKMGPNEALRFLQDTNYKKEMEEFDISSKGIKNIDAALNASLMRSFMKLYTISDLKMQRVISTYLLRYDLENIKMILRSKFAKVNTEEVEPLLYSSLHYSKEFMKQLLSKNSSEEVLNSLDFLKKEKIRALTQGSSNKKSKSKNILSQRAGKYVGLELFETENMLDVYYLELLWQFSSTLRGQGKKVALFLQQEIEATNIKTIIKLKQAKYKGDIFAYLVHPSRFVSHLASMDKELDDLVRFLHKHKFTGLTGEEKDMLARLEIDLDVSLLKKEQLLMHQSLLSANSILGYLFAKEIEVRNLKALVKGKKLGVDEKYLEQLLVIAK
ncbi:V-type ATPase subunit [Candidatus Woesearchaeota archaeon]|nr:V-type ATPase subunit [Candidatus Woesearchaeota archaeon]